MSELISCYNLTHKSDNPEYIQAYAKQQELKRMGQLEESKKTLLQPEHYTGWVIGDFITKQNLTFYEGNVVKYICRHRKKDGLKDLIKARNYLNKVIDEYNPN